MIETCRRNALKFRFVRMACWFASEGHFDFITSQDRPFIAALKNHRRVALSEEGRKKKRFVRVGELTLTETPARQGGLKGYAKALRWYRQAFANKDGSTESLLLAYGDSACDDNEITPPKKSGPVAVFHPSLKSNANLAKSPTRTKATPSSWPGAARHLANVAMSLNQCQLHGQPHPLGRFPVVAIVLLLCL
jgi:hypothetical protein